MASRFKKQLIKLLNNSFNRTDKQSPSSNFSNYLSSSSRNNALRRSKVSSSVICNEMKCKYNKDISQLALFTPYVSGNDNNNRTNRKNKVQIIRRKGYADILLNGSMKDIHSHSPNFIDSFSSSTPMRLDYSTQRANSIKERIYDYSRNMANCNRNNSKTKPISIMKRYEGETCCIRPMSTIMRIKSFVATRRDCNRGNKEKSFNVLQIDRTGKGKAKDIKGELSRQRDKDNNIKERGVNTFRPQREIQSFNRTNSYNMLFYSSEIDKFKKGFKVYEH